MSGFTTDRITQLRTMMVNTVPEIFADRARLITESYAQTKGLPYVLRRAKALAHILDYMDICMTDGELIVGSYAGKPRGCQVYPEYDMTFVMDELDTFQARTSDRFIVSEQTKQELRALYPQWKNSTIADAALTLFPEEAKESVADGMFLMTALRCGIGHIIVDYGLCLREGIRGIKRRVAKARSTLKPSDLNYAQRLLYCEAADICCDAVVRFAHRFQSLAEEQLTHETDAARRCVLEQIARNCACVPEQPARTLWEALQSFWFLHLVLHLESNGHSVSPGRFDQYMYPYYERDRAAGVARQTQEELIQATWLKMFELNKVRDQVSTVAFSGYPMFQNLQLGGQDACGKSAVNELSYICLNATKVLKVPQPSLSIRWFSGCPDDFLQEALKVVGKGMGMPALFNDEVLIPNMLQMGYSLEQARDYGIVGCTEFTGQGNAEPWLTGGFINALKPLELVVNNGYDPVLKKKKGLSLGEVEQMETYEELEEAYLQQLVHFLDQQVCCDNILDHLHGELCPTIFASLFISGCIDRGLSNLNGGADHNSTTLEVVGMPNVADGLMAVKKLIYDEKKLTWATLKAALDCNFSGYEWVQGMLLNQAPKYGNDNDEVDAIAARIVNRVCFEAKRYRSPRNGSYVVAMYSISSHVLFASHVHATPDGRNAGDLLADGGVSCAHGRDKEGVTALLNTIVKMDPYKLLGSALLNVRLAPSLFEEERLSRVADVVKTFFLKRGNTSNSM
ncbi:MAG: formate C-acetyltransferase/glycerol dehydratase family glycyl radical enzyme [Desulfosporosinus sp.]|nr:formate C-acetyltransferase/glycerol dehydratase family glycyl radical enzyme [Desulfosporosinus sp.]